MSYFEYMVAPAPREAPRRKGVKSVEGRFAHGLSEVLNRHAADGWEFQRTETMRAETRRGFLRGTSVETVDVMIFRRWVEAEDPTDRQTARIRDDAAPSARQSSPQLRPVPAAEPPLDPAVERAPSLDPGRPRREEHGRRDPLLGANRHADLPLRPVPGPDRT